MISFAPPKPSIVAGKGTLAARPASGTVAGQLYYVTDAGAQRWTRWNGTVWEDIPENVTQLLGLPVPTAQGGTGQNFSATAQGNVLFFSAAGVLSALAPGTVNQVLTTGGTGANPSWQSGWVGAYAARNLVGSNNAGFPNSVFGWSADLIVLRNPTTGTIAIRTNTGTVNNDVTIAGPVAGGRDQAAAFAANTWIHFYTIWDGTTLNSLSSAVAPPTGPTLPTGFTYWDYEGSVRYNATPVLVKTRWAGASAWYEAAQNALNAGTATVETAVSLTTFVPPNGLRIDLRSSLTASGTGVFGKVRIVTGVEFFVHSGVSASAFDSAQLTVPNLGQQVFYLVGTAAANLTIDVLGYSMPNGGE